MATTQIWGNTQIRALSIFDAQIAAAAAIATSKLADAANFILRTGVVPFSADQSMGSHYLTNLLDPVNPQDAATRAWVLAQMASVTNSSLTARAATTANITLSNVQTVDGVSLAANDLCLVKNQTTASQNGVYKVVSGGAWVRAAGMDTWGEVPGSLVSVQEGTVNADTLWLSVADAGGTINSTSITFTQVPGPSDIVAGAGLTRTGQQIDVVAGDNSLTVNPDDIRVKLSATGAIIISGSAGLAVNIQATTLQISANVLGVKLDSAGAILGGSSGLAVNYDANTLAIAGNVLSVKPNLFLASNNILWRSAVGGTIDGSNTVFTLSSTPNPAGTETVFLNGILQEPNGEDYTISGATITFVVAPPSGSRIRVTYVNRSLAPA
jgi:hypothetical protein